MIAKFPVNGYLVDIKRETARRILYLGLIRLAAVNKTPMSTQTPPTTTYAIPMNEFFPPITVLVDIMIDLVPPYSVTLKPKMTR